MGTGGVPPGSERAGRPPGQWCSVVLGSVAWVVVCAAVWSVVVAATLWSAVELRPPDRPLVLEVSAVCALSVVAAVGSVAVLAVAACVVVTGEVVACEVVAGEVVTGEVVACEVLAGEVPADPLSVAACVAGEVVAPCAVEAVVEDVAVPCVPWPELTVEPEPATCAGLDCPAVPAV